MQELLFLFKVEGHVCLIKIIISVWNLMRRESFTKSRNIGKEIVNLDDVAIGLEVIMKEVQYMIIFRKFGRLRDNHCCRGFTALFV